MKKGLSILLIAAALFGFYGSAVNLNDVLACKDYWEKAGEESTANMNKLEDGLNQLKENEQAYLDGKDQVADGEVALAEGEQTLAEGEAKLADGEAQYAEGLKSYQEAPAKLAAGEAKLAEGYESRNNLLKLIDGLNTVKKHGASSTSHHDVYWHDAFSHTVSDSVIQQMAAGKKTNDSPGLRQARGVITQTLVSSKDDVKLIEGLTGTSGIVNGAKNAKSYAKFNDAMKKAYDAFDDAEKQIKALIKMANQYSETIGGMLDPRLATTTTGVPQSAAVDAENNFTDTKPFNECNLSELKKGIEVLNGTKTQLENGISQYEAGIAQLEAGIAQLEAGIAQLEQAIAATDDPTTKAQLEAQKSQYVAQKEGYENQVASLKATKEGLEGKLGTVNGSLTLLNQAVGGREKAQGMLKDVISKYGEKFEAAAESNADIKALYGLMQVIANNAIMNPQTGAIVGMDESNQVFYAYVNKLKGGLEQTADALNKKLPVVKSSKNTFKAWMDGYKKLAAGKDGKGDPDLASTKVGIPYAFDQMLSNSTIKAALKTYDKGLIKELKKYTGAHKNKLRDEDFEAFDKDITHIAKDIIPRAQKVLANVKADANRQLADGERQLAQGKADYAAAPGKLADARRQLADGRQQLEDGRKALEEGRQTLADGKAQLAQYEDGEQQVRDGLATLTETEADLDLESILDRLKGDNDFDNGDEHLDLDEGLAAVEVGRGYQAEDGVLITKEIMARAVGTGALLGAGALAVLAAILSFLKKNKGAGVFAILAAAAGAFGAAYGTNAGTYFSDIAGSTAGSAAWVAAGILGAVALVHAIVHFTAKKEA